LKFLLLTYYYYPDVGPGSFRSEALADKLSQILDKGDHIHIITTQPSRYNSFQPSAKKFEQKLNISVHRIKVPQIGKTMIAQIFGYMFYAFKALLISFRIKPDLFIATTSRLMTGLLGGVLGRMFCKRYIIDLRDIFSDSISETFSKKNQLLTRFLKQFFLSLEKVLLKNAVNVNIVSEAFADYYSSKGLNVQRWTFYSNGIDKEFTDIKANNAEPIKCPYKVLYAGNIGLAQALHTIIPDVAIKLKDNFHFFIIGDGNGKDKLQKRLNSLKINNVELIPPVTRESLMNYYANSDILFLHLSDLKAYERVLPSKIFEYGALRKPVIAGVSGYAKSFINKNIDRALVFKPQDIDMCSKYLNQIITKEINIKKSNDFIREYSREKIMKAMTAHIYKISKEKQ
jgi:hypothetical protein